MSKSGIPTDDIRTTGELRKFLAGALLAVRDGGMTPEIASRVTKLAAQVNESFYSEIKIQKVMLEAGKELGKLGALRLEESE